MNNTKLKKVGIIDIGSNSVRLLISDQSAKLQSKQLISTRLGEGLAHTGALSQSAMLRTENAVATFVDAAKTADCTPIYIFATEAVRAATNGNDFCRSVFLRTGFTIDVLSGDDEAKIGFIGAAGAPTEPTCVIDVGGASVEVVCGQNEALLYKKSLPLGMLRLLDLFGRDRKTMHEQLALRIHEFGAIPHTDLVLGIGGTLTAIGAMAHGIFPYDAKQVHGTSVSLFQLKALEERVFLSRDVKADFPVLSENRAQIIGHGLVLLSELLPYLGCEKITVSEQDNLEGYLLLKNK